MLGHLPVFPGRIAALRDLKRLAEQGDRELLAVLSNELKLHSWPREKMPIAFFSTSRSCRSNSFSRFRWRISASCRVFPFPCRGRSFKSTFHIFLGQDHLSGVEIAEAEEILKDENLQGTDETWERFVKLYGGNPLALKLACEPIQDR